MTSRKGGSLLLTRNFPPLRGGMERLNLRLLQGLGELGPVSLVGPTGSSRFVPTGTSVREVPAQGLIRFVLAMAWESLLTVVHRAPQRVVAGSGLTAPFAWLAARIRGARCIAYIHGLDIVVPSRAYQLFWMPFIRRCDLLLVNSRHVAELATRSGVPAARIRVVNPGADIPDLDAGAAQRFRVAHGLGDRPILLSIGRITPRKGLLEFVEDVLPQVVATWPNACLVVIGEEATHGLHVPGFRGLRDRILASAAERGMGENLRFLGSCDDETLSDAFQASNLHVFPVCEMAGDVEGFGMVAVEAGMHGLATVAYGVGGVPDAVVHGRTGLLVQPADTAAMTQAILELLANPLPPHQVRDSSLTYAWSRFHEEVRSAIEMNDAS